MSKFCANCGNQLNDNDMFCQNCGARQEVAQQPYMQQPMQASKPAAKLPLSKNMLIAIGAAAVLVIALIIIISTATAGGGYKSAIDNMIDVTFKGKLDKIEDCYPKEYWEYMEEELDMNLKEMIEELEDEEVFEDMMDELEDEYGKNVKISYKVLEDEKADKDIFDSVKEGLKDNYDIPKKNLKEVREVELEMTIKGKDDKDSEETTLYIAKIGKKWYIVNTNGPFSGMF